MAPRAPPPAGTVHVERPHEEGQTPSLALVRPLLRRGQKRTGTLLASRRPFCTSVLGVAMDNRSKIMDKICHAPHVVGVIDAGHEGETTRRLDDSRLRRRLASARTGDDDRRVGTPQPL